MSQMSQMSPERAELSPAHIMQVGMGFWASKTLLSAVELEVFTQLADGAMTGDGDSRDALGLHARAIPDFPDALVALGSSIATATAGTAATATRRRPRPSSTRPARPTSAGSSRCATRGCTASGAT